MALSENKVSVHNFIGGLITDYQELNTPPDKGYTVDEANCELNRKGFRQRRLGIAYEPGYTQNATQYSQSAMASQYIGKYQWSNINNSGTLNYLVVQTGNTLSFYDLSFTPISGGLKSFTVNLDTYAAPGVVTTANSGISVASGNGQLFVVGELINPFYITYNKATDSITVTPITIQIRDWIEQDGALPPSEQDTTVTQARLYDLYNQGWSSNQVRLYDFNTKVTVEAGNTSVINFYRAQEGKYPPKTGPWWVGKRIGDKGIEVFDPNQYNSVEKGNSLTSLGHYILNAFNIDRSAASGISGLPVVNQTLRPNAVAFFAGKVFYALGNTIYFSQTITDTSDLSGVGKCYQEADPTTEQINNLIATDGGTITIPSSAESVAFFTIENSLLFFSTNGTWIISGAATNSGFGATDYSINKISSVSCTSPRTLIDADGVPIWWAPQGIYTLKPMAAKQSFEVENISLKRIQNFYDAILPLAKKNATGAWDHIQKRAIWLFSSASNQSDVTNRFYYNDILVLDRLFDSYIHHTISDYSVLPCSKLVDIFNIQQVQTSTSTVVITDNSGNAIVDHTGAGVTVNTNTLVNTTTVTHDTNYMVVGPVGVSGAGPTTKMTIAFADFTSCDFLDWSDYTTIGLGADYTSYLDCYYTIAGYMTPHFQPSYDAMLWMYSPYVYVYLEQPARACQTTVITIPGAPPGTTSNQILAYNDTDGLGSTNHIYLADYTNNKVYRMLTGDTPTFGVIRQFDASTTGNELLSVSGASVGYYPPAEGGEATIAYNGDIVYYSSGPTNKIVCLSGADLSLVGTIGTQGVPGNSTHVATPLNMAPLRWGTTDYVISTAQRFIGGGKELDAISIPAMTNTVLGNIDENQPIVGRGAVGLTSGTAMVLGAWGSTDYPKTTLGFYVITGNVSGISFAKKGTIAPASVDATWTQFTNATGVAYDQTDGNAIVLLSNSSGTTKNYLVKIRATDAAVLWSSAVTTAMVQDGSGMPQWNIVNGSIYYLDSGNTLRIINTSNGSQTTQTLNSLTYDSGIQISDDVANTITISRASWTDNAALNPTYLGTYMGSPGNHHTLNNKDARWFVGGITTPGTPNTYLYNTTITPNASSCLLQVAWDWANAAASNKWSQQVETYRYRANFSIATSKNKVRGKGKTMQLRFSSTSGKDFNLVGWGVWYNKNLHP